jgi:hypothetical protein
MLLLICAFILCVVLVVWGTVAQNAWGLNFRKLVCPRCIHTIPRGAGLVYIWRFFAGRAVCPECQTLVDKWGRELLPNEKDRKRAQRHLPKS